MNQIVPFTYEGTSVRTVTTEDGRPLFCGKDVAVALGYTNTKDALARHCRGVVKRYPIVDSLGRTQEARFITEGDLYRLVFNSKLPTAEKFEAWVVDDVLPAILKHGGYLTPDKIEEALTDPDTIIQLAQTLKREQARRKELEAQAEKDAPKVLFADTVATAETSILVGQLAKILNNNGMKVGQNRLFKDLRARGYLSRRQGCDWNMPTQKSRDLDLFEIKESTHSQPDGTVRITKTTKVTGKGQLYFIDHYLKDWDKKLLEDTEKVAS
ncbi:MAG: phage antirepressor [Actinomycetaceae bacterium]|nr:phage antirepressor [Actinomycetaceae bacterium]